MRNLLSAGTTTNEGAPSFAHFAKEPALSEAEGWDSTLRPSEDLEIAPTGKGTTLVAPQHSKKWNRDPAGTTRHYRRLSPVASSWTETNWLASKSASSFSRTDKSTFFPAHSASAASSAL